MSDPKRADSLVSTLAELQRVGGNVRERLSARLFAAHYQSCENPRTRKNICCLPSITAVLERLSGVALGDLGNGARNITRGTGWLFTSIGRRVLSAPYIRWGRASLMITAPFTTDSWPLLEYLLEVPDSSMTYRSRYYTTLQPVAVLDTLMADGTNPRSLEFQLSHLADLYGKLPRYAPEDLSAIRHSLDLLRSLDLRNVSYPLEGSNQSNQPQGDSKTQLRLDQALGLVEECCLPGPTMFPIPTSAMPARCPYKSIYDLPACSMSQPISTNKRCRSEIMPCILRLDRSHIIAASHTICAFNPPRPPSASGMIYFGNRITLSPLKSRMTF